MTKDPAFLFYYQDFIVGTNFMSLEEKGAYITLLCYLADQSHITEPNILKIIPQSVWENISMKFIKDKKGFYNDRLKVEIEKRKAFTMSRRQNLHMGKHMGKHMARQKHTAMADHMENENEDVNIIKDKDVSKVEPKQEQYTHIATLTLKTSYIDTKKEIYPMLDIEGEIRDCVSWYHTKGGKVKSWERAITNWIKKSYERVGVVGQAMPVKAKPKLCSTHNEPVVDSKGQCVKCWEEDQEE